jgi:hypothetical protein
MIDDVHLAMQIVHQAVENGRLLEYTWRNTIAINLSAAGRPAELVSPYRIARTIERLKSDAAFREEVLGQMRNTDVKFYNSRWDRAHIHATERTKRRNIVRNRNLKRRDIFRTAIAPQSSSVNPSAHEILAATLLHHVTPSQLPREDEHAASVPPPLRMESKPPPLSITDTPTPILHSTAADTTGPERSVGSAGISGSVASSLTSPTARLVDASQRRSFAVNSMASETAKPELRHECTVNPTAPTPMGEISALTDAPTTTDTLDRASPTLGPTVSGDTGPQAESFSSYTTNASVIPMRGSFRSEFDEMMGIVAVRDIPAGTLILTWSGVDVDASTFESTKDQLCNKEHVLEYALEYGTEFGTRVVCPRLNHDGRPELGLSDTPTLDVCWACLINEPAPHHVTRYNFKEQAFHLRRLSKKQKANARIAVTGGRAIILACEDIKRGDEITMRYTDAYKGQHSYNAGMYKVGEHASRRRCEDIHIEWNDLNRLPATPVDVFTRYLLPKHHTEADAINTLLRHTRQLIAIEKQSLEDKQHSFASRRDMIPTVTWQDVEHAQKAAARTMLSLGLWKKLQSLRTRLMYILFVPIYIEGEWLIDERRTLHRALFVPPTSTLVTANVVDVWRQIDAIVTDGRRTNVEITVSDELETLLEEHGSEDEVADASRDLYTLREAAATLTRCIAAGTVTAHMKDFITMWQRNQGINQLLHIHDE